MLHYSTHIKLLNGTMPTLEELSHLIKNHVRCFCYSITPDMKIVPDEIISINKQYLTEACKMKLDTGDSLECDKNQIFITPEFYSLYAEDILSYTSIIPMSFQYSKNHEFNYDREMYYDFVTNTYMYTHHMVKFYYEPKTDFSGFEIHHINENYRDNNPTNLMWLDKNKHKAYHDKTKELRFNKDKDMNMQNKQKRDLIAKSGACLIKKYTNLTKDLIESHYAKQFLRYPLSDYLIKKYFVSYDEFFNLSYEAEQFLSQHEYESLTRSPEDRKSAKRNKMLKIGKAILDDNNQISEITYEEKRKYLHSKAPDFSKLTQYFNDLQDFITQSQHYNHKIIMSNIMTYNKKEAFYHIKLKSQNNFCITLPNSFIIVHV